MEVVRLCRIDSERFIPFYVVSRQSIGDLNDWGEKLQRVRGCIDFGGKQHSLSLISRLPSYSTTTCVDPVRKDPVADFCSIWASLKQAKIPVAATLRKTATSEVMVTDYCSSGGCLYDKHAAYCVEDKTRQAGQLDQIFVELNPQEIKDRAEVILSTATEARISMHYDDPLNLVVFPNGKWRLVALDIGHVKLNSRTAWSDNIHGLEYLMSYMDILRNSIRGTTLAT